MFLERNFSLKLFRVIFSGYFRFLKFFFDIFWLFVLEEVKEWVVGFDCKKLVGRCFNRLAGGWAFNSGVEGEGFFRIVFIEVFFGVFCFLDERKIYFFKI